METLPAPTPTRRHQGAIPAGVVARLSGIGGRRLQYWHRVGVLRAHATRSGHGVPRMYTWDDYIKVRAAEGLLKAGSSAQRVRRAIEYLDQYHSGWTDYRLYVWGQDVVFDAGELPGRMKVAARGEQIVSAAIIHDVLAGLRKEGPLGRLHEFGDQVSMDPAVVAGNPVIRDTRITTALIASLLDRGMTVEDVAKSYRLTPAQVRRAVDFEHAAA